jgi:hypothetical protein
MAKQTYVVRGIDVQIGRERIAEGEEVTLDLAEHGHLKRWLEPVSGEPEPKTEPVDGKPETKAANKADKEKA